MTMNEQDGQDNQDTPSEESPGQPGTLPEATTQAQTETQNRMQSEAETAMRTDRLCTAVGDAVGRALAAASAGTWQIRPLVEQEGGSPDGVHQSPDKPTPDKLALCFAFTLTGSLAGRCFLAVSRQDAATLAAASGKPAAAVLLKALQGAAAELSERLSATYPELGVTAGKAKAADASALELRRLQAVAEGAGAATVWLGFDPQLQQSLADPDGARRALNGALGGEISAENLDLVLDVPLSVTLRFGQRQLALREVLELASGSVVELDRQVDEPVELILDGRVIARGEAVIVDGNYGVRVTQVVQAVGL
jgi:flagellar motor switch protein FliN/FliY